MSECVSKEVSKKGSELVSKKVRKWVCEKVSD